MAATQMQGRGPPKGNIELFSPTYFAACGLGGIVSCGPTHTGMILTLVCTVPARWSCNWPNADLTEAVTPLDLVRHPFIPEREVLRKNIRITHAIGVTRSNAAVKSTPIFTRPTSPLGAASSPRKVSEASSSAGHPLPLATLSKAPANTVSTKSSNTTTARNYSQMPTKLSSTSAPLLRPNS